MGYVRASDGAVRVSHHNLQTNDMDKAQRGTLRFARKHALHNASYRYRRQEEQSGEYVVDQGIAFVVGVRRDATWAMYAQCVQNVTRTNMNTGVFSQAMSITSASEF